MQKLKKNMALMVYCHQKLNRDFKICMDGSKFMLTITNLVIMLYSCMLAYLVLKNDVLRQSLASLPWINKPDWFKKTLYIMMTRANVNNEMRPYGIYSLSYLSFKDSSANPEMTGPLASDQFESPARNTQKEHGLGNSQDDNISCSEVSHIFRTKNFQ
ncbi:uncharacterized protein LOC111043634 isoform X3 [Nilaparvata lugens]|uniref:uncharacterized protein LOC111043634 isoform X3 n=1 Tax=Nilaparvata lugens TaxID=108931 RepID=UPI00193E943B|nr:uncharacterized protein LOC111043634 isoform X3 [Nilaparvata lugens]